MLALCSKESQPVGKGILVGWRQSQYVLLFHILINAVDEQDLDLDSGETKGWGGQVWGVASCLCNPQKGVNLRCEYIIYTLACPRALQHRTKFRKNL